MKKQLLLAAVTVITYHAFPQSIKIDKNIYLPPSAPTLPAAGGKITDPTFGTEILRVTGPNDGNDNTHAYSYWPCFNVNSSVFYVYSVNGTPTIYDLDTANFTISNKRHLFQSAAPDGDNCRTDDVIWSGIDMDVVYAHTAKNLYKYNIINGQYTLVKDFSTQFQNLFLTQMSKSIDDNVFGFTIKNDNTYNEEGYFAYNVNINSYYHVATNQVDEVQVDKEGNYLVVKTGQSGNGVVEVKIVNLNTEVVVDLIDGAPDYSPGHSDNGHGFVVGGDNWNNVIRRRSFADPHTHFVIHDGGNDWTNDNHLSMTADNEEWALISNFTGGSGQSLGLFKDEIFQVATDGSQNVRRLAHHQSIVNDYWDQPRANISRDGKFICFTSNWGGTNQRDVFIAKIPAAPVSGTTQTLVSINEKNVMLYPNPANDKIFIRSSENIVRVIITNTLGQVVQETNVINNEPLELSMIIPTGLYSVQLITENNDHITKRIIKDK